MNRISSRRIAHRHAKSPARARPGFPEGFCLPLEHRLLLSFAPSSLSGDTLVTFAASGTHGSVPPIASVVNFTSDTALSDTDLLSSTSTAATYTYLALGDKANLIVTEPSHLVNVSLTFTTAQSGTYTTNIADLFNPESQSGIFVLYSPSAQPPAPASLTGQQITFNPAGGAGTVVATSGAVDAQFYSNNTFNALVTPVSGSPSTTQGSFSYSSATASVPSLGLVQITDSGSPTIHALLAFVSADGGAFYLTDATASNGDNGSPTDFSYGSFNFASFTKTNTLASLAPAGAPAAEGTPVTFQAIINPNVGGANTATGTVTFKEGTTILGTAPLDGTGAASFSTSSLTPGTHAITALYGGDANFFGSITPAAVNQIITYTHATNVAYVTQVYNDLLHRDPDGPGLDFWTNRLDSGVATLADVATSLTSSREYDGIVVDSFYVQYLGRHSEINGLNFWVDQMQTGLNAEVIRAGILGSDEYYNRIGATDTAYITILYSNFLHRDPDGPGLAVWIAQLDHSSLAAATAARTVVSSSISNSTESRTDIATGFYVTFLHRDPDDAGLQVWIANLANGVTQPQIISFFVTTQEYLNLHTIT